MNFFALDYVTLHRLYTGNKARFRIIINYVYSIFTFSTFSHAVSLFVRREKYLSVDLLLCACSGVYER